MTQATDIQHQRCLYAKRYPVGRLAAQSPKSKQFRKFDYVGNSAVKGSLNPIEQLHLNSNHHLLSQMNVGDLLKIEQICVGGHIARQLASLQLKRGKTIRLIDKTKHDSVLVELSDRLVGFNPQIARQIIVTSAFQTNL